MAKPRPSAPPEPTASDPRLPPVGTTLRRRYKGQDLAIHLRADGFEHDSTIYPSLSAVAKAITGSHLNGFAFFGLTGSKQ